MSINLRKSGICENCGQRLNNPSCTHATKKEIEYVAELDKAYDNAKLPSGNDLDIDTIYDKYFPARNTSQSSDYVKGSIRADNAVVEAYELEKGWIDEVDAQAQEAHEWNETYADVRADMIGNL